MAEAAKREQMEQARKERWPEPRNYGVRVAVSEFYMRFRDEDIIARVRTERREPLLD